MNVSSASPNFVLEFDPIPPTPPPEVVHAKAVARGAECTRCPLYGCGRGPVMGTIRPGAPLIAVGEAPGENECIKGEGFVGATGRILNSSLSNGGLERSDVSITNTILCMPEGGNFAEYLESLKSNWRRAMKRWERQWFKTPADVPADPEHRAVAARKQYKFACEDALTAGEPMPEPPPVEPIEPQVACRARLERDIHESNSLVTLAVGKQALEQTASILGLEHSKDKSSNPDAPKYASIRKQHGAPILLSDGKVLMATYHPAFAMRDKCEYMPVIRENIARAARIARRNGKIDWSEPPYILNPNEETITRVLNYFLDCRAEVTIDIETDGGDSHEARVRCVGLGARINGEEIIICVPFNYMSGIRWWDDEAKFRIAMLVRRVMDELPLVLQNGSFDTTVMLRVGLMTNRRREWDDTLLLHHDTPDNDLPHDLGFITRRYFEVSLWKENVDHKSVDAGGDQYLHLYNCRDVLATMRVVWPLRDLVIEYVTEKQYDTDRRMAVRTRDMSELGIPVNEWERGACSEHFNKQCRLLTTEFQQLARRPVNPRSPKQLQDLFYGDWGYLPVVATDGYEWHEEEDDVEDGSTSNQALTRLQTDRIGDPNHPHYIAIEKLLEFRANDKVRGVNVDNLKTYRFDWSKLPNSERYYSKAPPVYGELYDPVSDKTYNNEEILPEREALSICRTTYKGHVVPTGRLASGDPVNFQNITKRARGNKNLRDLFVAPPGHVIVGADYEQIEARLYAIIAQDKLLLEAIRTGLDIHSLNAASLLAEEGQVITDVYKWLKEKPKDELSYIRTVAKRFCFGKIYGAGWQKIFQVMGADRDKATGLRTFPKLTEKDCQTWSNNWDRLHPETKIWHGRCHSMFKEFGYTNAPMLDYRKRFFPGGVAQENAIPNLTIQGSAASIANKALLEISDLIPYRGWSHFSGLVFQVHDYIAVVVPERRAYEAAEIIERCMYYEFEGMAFPAKPEITWTWGAQ
jgi:DNA polymerase I-like protein with 3'-5' exonuclease and polymerase domains/uracil-DNA glycosylase